MARKKKTEEVEEIALVTDEAVEEAAQEPVKEVKTTVNKAPADFDMNTVWNMLIRNRQAGDIISYIVRTSKNEKTIETLNKLPHKNTALALESLGIISSDAQKYFITQLAKEYSLISSLNRTNRLFNKTAMPTDSYEKILADLA